MENILLLEDDYELNQALCFAMNKETDHVETAFSIRAAKALDLLLLDSLPIGRDLLFADERRKERKYRLSF